MKVLVAIKRVVDFNVKIKINETGRDIETHNVKMSINPFDEIALEEAIRLKEKNTVQEIIAVSIGDLGSKEVLNHALALGADRGILIEKKQSERLESFHIAQLLKHLVLEEKVNLVLLGKQAIDDDCNQAGQMLAALLGWPQGTFASELKLDQDRIQVVREVDGGLETLNLTLPAVVTVDLRLNQPRFPSMIHIMKAKTKPLLHRSAESFSVDFKTHLELLGLEPPKKREAGKKVGSLKELFEILPIREGHK